MTTLKMNKENTSSYLTFANEMFEQLLDNEYLTDDILSDYEYINRKRIATNKFYTSFRNIRDMYIEMTFNPKERKANDTDTVEILKMDLKVSKMSLEDKFAALLAA